LLIDPVNSPWFAVSEVEFELVVMVGFESELDVVASDVFETLIPSFEQSAPTAPTMIKKAKLRFLHFAVRKVLKYFL